MEAETTKALAFEPPAFTAIPAAKAFSLLFKP
ncbi:hypothetical protein CCACVL1_29074 [Corchorus capsularis]|uniref:Uncharacterized protein n=1 Tax=Corchorus capsularis TaxID=210143 RepID=A0A1R3G3Z2_COCAP|nr:hypothetical protein CCACVL1_29074 [Corchorus capsularis]